MKEFLITSTSLFLILYTIFWIGFLGSQYSLAKYYLTDFSNCELGFNTMECWPSLKRRLASLKFVVVKKLSVDHSPTNPLVLLKFDFNLPILGLPDGIQNLEVSTPHNPKAWQ